MEIVAIRHKIVLVFSSRSAPQLDSTDTEIFSPVMNRKLFIVCSSRVAPLL